jgi:hypothetical protein
MIPDPTIGPTEISMRKTKTVRGGVKPVRIVNHRKMQGWKAELLVEYNNGTRDFGTINSLIHDVGFVRETEEYLEAQNLVQENATKKWRMIGYDNDPKKKSRSSIHDYDDNTELPEFKNSIKEICAKYSKGSGKKGKK